MDCGAEHVECLKWCAEMMAELIEVLGEVRNGVWNSYDVENRKIYR